MNSNQCAWMTVSEDKEEAVVTVVNVLSYAQPYLTKTKLMGLDPQKKYENVETHEVFGGDELMNMGFYDQVAHKDFTAKMYHFKAVK